jgi:hypothetical protein
MPGSASNEYGMTRVNTGSFGWLVRLQRNGKAYARFFSDKRFGGIRIAQAAAREFRDQVLEQLPPPSRRIRAERLTVRNSSGVVGVCRIVRDDSNGARYEFWQATWSPAPGIRKTAKFSIRRYGDADAFKRARAARERGLNGIE